MNFEILVLLLAASAVYAQKPVPCTTPPQWSSRFTEYNRADGRFVQGKVSYDAIYKRVRTIEQVQLGKNQTFLDILRLYNSKTEYVFDIVAKKCTTQPISRDWVSKISILMILNIQKLILINNIREISEYLKMVPFMVNHILDLQPCQMPTYLQQFGELNSLILRETKLII